MKAIILAGGKGVRLLPHTAFIPKPLVPIGEKPILEIILRQLISYGLNDIAISVGHLSGLIEAYFQNSDIKKLAKISYVRENKPLGTAGSLSLIKGLKDTFIVMNGDILTTLDYKKLIDFHKRAKSILTIATYKKSVDIDLGVMETNKENILMRYIEKPKESFKVSMGIYVYEPAVMDYIEPGKYLDFPSLVNKLLKAGEKVMSFPFEGYWLDIGRHEDYAKAQEEFDGIKGKLFKKRGL